MYSITNLVSEAVISEQMCKFVTKLVRQTDLYELPISVHERSFMYKLMSSDLPN